MILLIRGAPEKIIMAAWQFDLHLIPRSKVLEVFIGVPDTIKRDVFDRVVWWGEFQPPPDSRIFIGSFLDEAASWNKETLVWGDQDDNRVDVTLSRGDVAEIFIRVNVRELKLRFREGIVAFAKYCECLLLTEEMKLIEPDLSALTSEINQSPARRYVADPVAFLDDLKEKGH